jgi:hypothetical protein
VKIPEEETVRWDVCLGIACPHCGGNLGSVIRISRDLKSPARLWIMTQERVEEVNEHLFHVGTAIRYANTPIIEDA